MFPTPQDSSEALLQHCRFPTSPQRDIGSRLCDSVTVFHDDTILPALGGSFEFSKDLILAAWALLLRAYLRNDFIAFAVLLDDQASCCYQNDTNGTSFNANTEASVLQFQFADHFQVKDVHAAVYRNSSRQVLKTNHINTAINLSAPVSPTTGVRNAYLARLTGSQPVN